MVGLFKARLNDYQKDKFKSLLKEEERYSRTQGNRYGGTITLGPHSKISNKGGHNKQVYLGRHDLKEYFAFEVLNRIGFNTPRARIVPHLFYIDEEKKQNPYSYDLYVASESIDNFIPIAAFLPFETLDGVMKKIIESDPQLLAINKRYQLDIKNQVIVDLVNDEKYKVSGNLFAADYAALLVQDKDFQPEGMNVGLIKRGERFIATFIDKDQCSFDEKSLDELYEDMDIRVGNSLLFKGRTRDQELAILNQIVEANSEGNFDDIFGCSRVRLTFDALQENFPSTGRRLPDLKKDCEGLKNNATTIVNTLATREELRLFRQREKLRSQLADNIIFNLNISDDIDPEALKAIIVEDLRAPYYRFRNDHCISVEDLSNEELLAAVTCNIKKEIESVSIIKEVDLKSEEKEIASSEAQNSSNLLFTILFSEIDVFVKEEISRLRQRKSTEKLAIFENLDQAIAKEKLSFINKDAQDKAHIVSNLIKHIDIIAEHHSKNISWRTPQSELNWKKFKINHEIELKKVDPSLDVKLKLKDSRLMTYKQYKNQLGFFSDNKVVEKENIDLSSDLIPPKKPGL